MKFNQHIRTISGIASHFYKKLTQSLVDVEINQNNGKRYLFNTANTSMSGVMITKSTVEFEMRSNALLDRVKSSNKFADDSPERFYPFTSVHYIAADKFTNNKKTSFIHTDFDMEELFAFRSINGHLGPANRDIYT